MKIRKKFAALFALSLIVFLPMIVLAQAPGEPTSLDSPITTTTGLTGLFTRLLKWLQYIFFVVAVVFIILTAFKYLQAQGDPAKVASAQQSLIWAAIAIVVALIAGGITPIVRGILEGLS